MNSDGNETGQSLRELRDELESNLINERTAGTRSRPTLGVLSKLPSKAAPLLVGAAFVAGGAGIAVAAIVNNEPTTQQTVPQLIAITTASGERVEFNCEADRQFFYDQVGGQGSAAIEDPDYSEPLPSPPEGICVGSPTLP